MVLARRIGMPRLMIFGVGPNLRFRAYPRRHGSRSTYSPSGEELMGSLDVSVHMWIGRVPC
jgi:hypothetical protein